VSRIRSGEAFLRSLSNEGNHALACTPTRHQYYRSIDHLRDAPLPCLKRILAGCSSRPQIGWSSLTEGSSEHFVSTLKSD
jgi:hypothetical protein